MTSIYHNRKYQLTVPDSFEELTKDQFIKLVPVLFEGGDEVKCKVNALRLVCGLTVYKWRMLTPAVIEKCFPYIEWLFSTKCTKQLIPEYNLLYGPISDFDNLKMGEFHFSEIYYKEIIEGKNECLGNLAAVLYRPGKKDYDTKQNKDGDIRQAFNPNLIQYFSECMDPWPAAIKQGIFTWYHACREVLINDNPLVFKDGSDFMSQFDTGLYGLMRSLAGNKLGSLNDIENMYVHTAMLELGLMREEQKYLEDQIEKMKK